MLQNGVSHGCACVKLKCPRGGLAPFWGAANLPYKVSRDMGYRSDSVAISRDMGPLRSKNIQFGPQTFQALKSPKYPILSDVLGDSRPHFLLLWLENSFSMSFFWGGGASWGCGSQWLYNRSRSFLTKLGVLSVLSSSSLCFQGSLGFRRAKSLVLWVVFLGFCRNTPRKGRSGRWRGRSYYQYWC